MVCTSRCTTSSWSPQITCSLTQVPSPMTFSSSSNATASAPRDCARIWYVVYQDEACVLLACACILAWRMHVCALNPHCSAAMPSRAGQHVCAHEHAGKATVVAIVCIVRERGLPLPAACRAQPTPEERERSAMSQRVSARAHARTHTQPYTHRRACARTPSVNDAKSGRQCQAAKFRRKPHVKRAYSRANNANTSHPRKKKHIGERAHCRHHHGLQAGRPLNATPPRRRTA